jgi:hypothetical protein
VSKQIIRPAQPLCNRTQHFQADARIARNEGEKILPRQHRQTRILRHRRISRTAVAIEYCHLAEEIAMTERSENHFPSIGIRDGDANAPAFDDIHRIPGVAHPEQTRAALELDGMQVAAKFLYCCVIQRREKRNTTQKGILIGHRPLILN